ncbi:SDR family oxidoreductase [Ancylomarina sp. 16SWW S1-10-2]|uniref:SDR family oxidoreductase n=1 Tax=Ancylomarina sp. 16SWW S1-10-2 TaxID=2499681 RepID=UPI0012AE83EE|nr:SDR family oxidoreductase [Ancylomarina sp. 16SWW S1-10-2]MRT92899.1 SDR family oxidoreductase [Ancylomarina sp. 16SWW S1-10-2]
MKSKNKKTLVIGAGGQIGKILIEQLENKGSSVVALVRSESKAQKFADLGVETVIADLEGDFEHAFKGCDSVVFTAGSGGSTGDDKTLLIDLWAAAKAIDYAKKNNIQHFVMVSGLGAANPDEFVTEIKPYLVAKHFADRYLMESGLPYTILRPGSLINDNGTGLIRTSRPAKFSDLIIPREDVASVINYSLSNNKMKGKVVEFFSGNESIDTVFDI